MEFSKYNSLENTYREAFINKVQYEGLSGGSWQITEKIDGYNFSFYTDGKTVKVGKRSGFIEEGENFGGCWEILAKYQQNVLDAHSFFCMEDDVLVISGELYGPGILNRVNYGPEKGFVAFDAKINTIQLTTNEVLQVCEKVGIPHTPVLAVVDSFIEAVNYMEEFKSTLYPEAEGPNISEGIVIKPVFPKFLSNGSRVVLKKKAAAFSEKVRTPKKFKDKSLNAGQQANVDVLSQYITDSRLKSVLSKVGEVTNKDFGKILGLFTLDILEDYNKEYEDNIKETSGDDWKGINKALQNRCSSFIKERFVKIIDGTF